MPTPTQLRAVAHPLRLQILSLLTGDQLCAAEVARELDTTQANASYHLRVLANAGLLVPAGEVRIRGGTAKRYRHPWRPEDRPDDQLKAGTDELGVTSGAVAAERQVLIRAIAGELIRRGAQHEDGRGEFVDAELWVERDTWTRCVDLVHEAATLIHDAAKPPRAEGTISVNMSAALFVLAAPTATSTGGPATRSTKGSRS